MRKLSFEEITDLRYSPDAVKNIERFPIYGMLDDIRSLHNVGSIFRTAEGARLSKLYLTGITGQPPRKEIDKTALGAAELVPWEYYQNPIDAVEKMKAEGIKIVVLEHTTHAKNYNEYQYSHPSCLVVGNEVFGVREEIVRLADETIEIPMFGSKQSLNVSIAFGISIYEILNQYLKVSVNHP